MDGPLKWHGGKHDLAKWIVGLMPPRCQNPNKPDPADPGWLHYVEPFFGGGAVLLANDPEGISEVANDRNRQLVNFWLCLQYEPTFEKLTRFLQAVPFSQPHWELSAELVVKVAGQLRLDLEDTFMGNWVEAAHFFVYCRQSLSGRMADFASITRNRTRRGMNEQVSAWLNAVEGLPAVHERLRRVLIVGPDDALNIIRKHDGPRTLFYLDPPYLHETRATTKEYGEFEMTVEQHHELLDALTRLKGRFLLSGYPSALYHRFEADHGWKRHEKQINNHASGAKQKKVMTECVWCNY